MPFEVAPKTEEQQRVQMGRIALGAIAAHIATIPDHLFRMFEWRAEGACGTVGCAIGHSIYLPEVVATGLRLCPKRGYPIVGNATGTDAVAVVFGAPLMDMRDLFGATDSNQFRTGPQVAQRVRSYLARTALR